MCVFHALGNGGKSILPTKMKSLSPKLVVMMETKRGGANKTHKNPATQVAIRLVVARDHDAHGPAGTDLVIEIKDPLPTLLPMCE